MRGADIQTDELQENQLYGKEPRIILYSDVCMVCLRQVQVFSSLIVDGSVGFEREFRLSESCSLRHPSSNPSHLRLR